MSVVVVTGTDTGVGKTVATAALACHARLAGIPVTVCKPVQTGSGPTLTEGDDDLAEVARLAGVDALVRGWRYPEPLAPVAAAELAGTPLPTRMQLRELVSGADEPGRLVIVEGAGGVLVEIGADGVTLRDVATDVGAPVLVVAAAGLGTLNHTALTVEALETRGVRCAGVVVGSFPLRPGPAEATNRVALGAIAPVRAALPAGAGALDPAAFADLSQSAFDDRWVRSLL
ncbi:dethiobiotin synthase [Mycolicibacterium sediminis]|uniref:ATP-dependent dethiobiotin synthetase BioD n=1 Tax=Mycolicibacterium sediminis TaxID=1286180 RepID=A0A7I7QV60_9MYCO|nr:dethiobiotin synthase [Mycolicibacterium sediminis]BBY29786.1 ATP-dependent dethiobiotin synthetase BioD [Mycolicibacterium sediminis]